MKKWFLLFGYFISVVGFSQDIDVQHYKFYIDLNEKEDFINAKAEIEIKFLKPTHSFSLDLARQMLTEGVSASTWQNKIIDNNVAAQRDGDQLVITLGDTAKAGETRKFSIAYSGTPKDGLIISKNKY